MSKKDFDANPNCGSSMKRSKDTLKRNIYIRFKGIVLLSCRNKLPNRFLERYKFHRTICYNLSALKLMISTEIEISRVLQVSHITPFDLCQIRPQTTTEWIFMSTNPSSQENNTETSGHNIPINHKTGERPFLI